MQNTCLKQKNDMIYVLEQHESISICWILCKSRSTLTTSQSGCKILTPAHFCPPPTLHTYRWDPSNTGGGSSWGHQVNREFQTCQNIYIYIQTHREKGSIYCIFTALSSMKSQCWETKQPWASIHISVIISN